jgi:hypothetical protein
MRVGCLDLFLEDLRSQLFLCLLNARVHVLARTLSGTGSLPGDIRENLECRTSFPAFFATKRKISLLPSLYASACAEYTWGDMPAQKKNRSRKLRPR